ncbi:LysR family transcriptional regulator [Gottfriedia sp. NPDC057991]|uniref:LysR family transcriptional regulator n=1 Tax=Gottfriedia sp. NPDC057991 TaxID=3346298 RepID=UPI0036D94EF1
MHIEQFEYIVEIAKQKSIKRAAEKLHVSSPALSQSITNLEKEMNIKIFHRSKSGMVPSKEGKVLIKKAIEIMNNIQEFKDYSKIYRKDDTVVLKISYAPAFGHAVLDSLMKFQEVYPDVQVEIHEKGPTEVLNDVRLGIVDIGLLPEFKSTFEDLVQIGYEEICKGKRIICVGKKSKFKKYQFVTPEDISEECFAIYSGEFVNKFINLFFSQNKLLFRTSNVEMIRNVVIRDQAITFAFDKTLKNDEDVNKGRIFPIPLVIDGKNEIPFWYIYSLERQSPKISKEFIKFLHEYLN